ncbi:MAG: GNAT family N-acetyltransferase [Candidatus Thermoplasmatota archaeon]|nr:GNAT family N-acetyltransferase [Candidatus Thermoplasmatota archaeon]
MKAEDVSVRGLEWDDFDDIVRCYYSYYDELSVNPDLGITLYASKPSLADEISWFSGLYTQFVEGRAFVSVAETGGHVGGICDIRPIGNREEEAHVGVLGIALIPEIRGMGIGEKMMSRTLNEARLRYKIIVLDVFTVNKAARKLYSKMGFKTIGVLPKALKRGGRYYDEERMYLEL